MKKVICLFGPTAAGKTSLSIKIAEKYYLEIISADSMQVYRGMDIGTAKIQPEETQGINHKLINIRNPDEYYSTMDFLNHSTEIINNAHKKNKPALVAGGTGLYFKALFNGMHEGPGKDEFLRDKLEKKFEKDRMSLYNELKKVDPVYAEKIHPNDMKRVVRALEVYALSGKPISQTPNNKPDFEYLKICLLPDRKKLYERINMRCEAMIKNGIIDETRQLISKYGKNHNAFNAIGYSHCIKHLEGEINFEEFARIFKRDTRRFAKRQYTLFKSFQDAVCLKEPDDDFVFGLIDNFLG